MSGVNWAAQAAKARQQMSGDRHGSVHGGSQITPSIHGGEENSDSDDDDITESEFAETRALFSPVSAELLASVVVLGADGDLARKKILPTLFNLWRRKLLPKDTIVFGYARKEMTSDEFRRHVFKCIYNPSQPQGERKGFMLRCHYITGQFNDPNALGSLLANIRKQEAARLKARREPSSDGPPGVTSLAALKVTVEPERQVRMYYMAVPPFLYADICSGLRAKGVADATPVAWLEAAADRAAAAGGADVDCVPTVERFVLEKPFGRDTESCMKMVKELSMLKEDEIFRIDHYLGKELVMNLLVLRFANVCFQAIWNRQHIKNVQVIFKEPFGLEGRGGYFDQYGIIRDVMQNHLLQVMALVAMEQPLSFSAEHIRAEKLKVLHACDPMKLQNLVTGQYVRCGEQPGYLEDPSITNKDSNTETFAAAVLHVHNPRWDGVPFVLKAGKALTDRKAEVRIQFHRVPGVVGALSNCAANELVVRVQPEESIYWKVQNKVPGLDFQVQQMRMDLLYAAKWTHKPPEAYERLLLEVLAGQHSNFVSAAELEVSWQIFTPVLHQLADEKVRPEPYPFGSRGPAKADELAHRFGMSKFGGGIQPYVYETPAERLVDVEHEPSAPLTSEQRRL